MASSAAASNDSNNSGSSGNCSNGKSCEFSLPETPFDDVVGHLRVGLLCGPVTLLPRDTSADPVHLGPPGARGQDQRAQRGPLDVHPISTALPNFVSGMDDGRLANTASPSTITTDFTVGGDSLISWINAAFPQRPGSHSIGLRMTLPSTCSSRRFRPRPTASSLTQGKSSYCRMRFPRRAIVRFRVS